MMTRKEMLDDFLRISKPHEPALKRNGKQLNLKAIQKEYAEAQVTLKLK